VISNVEAIDITDVSAIITWDTNEGANSQVGYSTSTGGSYTYTTLDPAYVTGHAVALVGLTPATPYYYVIRSTDADDGITTQSPEHTFTTLADPPPAPDITRVVVASARIGQEPVIAYAAPVTDTDFTIRLVKQNGSIVLPGDPANVQWIAVSVTGGIARLRTTPPADRDAGTGKALQTAAYADYDNAQWVYFPIVFNSTPAVVNNAHAANNEPYIAAPWNIGPLRFQPQFIDDAGVQKARARLQTIAAGGGVTDPELRNNYIIQADRGTYSDGDFVHFSTDFHEPPTVLANAWDAAIPVIASAWGNATTGFFIALRDLDGIPVSDVEVQWIAVGHIVDHITIPSELKTVTITAGDSLAYTVKAFFDQGDKDEISLGDVTDYTTFEIEPEAGGSWDGNVYTSENTGTWTVTATHKGKRATATLKVE